MRIIAGELKGRSVHLPKGSPIRPATGFVRELAMNLFTPARLHAGCFLDLCAGSGLMGFEAVSRGCPRAILVEADARTAALLRRSAAALGVEHRSVVLCRDARRCFRAVERIAGAGGVSAAFLDTPFIPGMAWEVLLRAGQAAGMLQGDALFIVRTPDELPSAVGALALREKRRAGNAWLWLYAPEADRRGG